MVTNGKYLEKMLNSFPIVVIKLVFMLDINVKYLICCQQAIIRFSCICLWYSTLLQLVSVILHSTYLDIGSRGPQGGY